MTTTTQFSAPSAAGTEGKAPQAGSPRAGLRSLLLDVAVPLGGYYVLRAAGCDVVISLALASVPPAARTAAALVRGQAVSALAVLILVVNVAGLAVTFWSGDPRLMLAKDGAVSSAIGLAILGSVALGRPLMTAGMRPFLVKGDAARDAAFGRLAATSARFRALERKFSVAWGLACLSECAFRVGCAFTLPVATAVWVSQVLLFACIGAGIVAGSFFSFPMHKMVEAEAARSGEAK